MFNIFQRYYTKQEVDRILQWQTMINEVLIEALKTQRSWIEKHNNMFKSLYKEIDDITDVESLTGLNIVTGSGGKWYL